MSAITLEERVATVERELTQIKLSLKPEMLSQAIQWWEKIARRSPIMSFTMK